MPLAVEELLAQALLAAAERLGATLDLGPWRNVTALPTVVVVFRLVDDVFCPVVASGRPGLGGFPLLLGCGRGCLLHWSGLLRLIRLRKRPKCAEGHNGNGELPQLLLHRRRCRDRRGCCGGSDRYEQQQGELSAFARHVCRVSQVLTSVFLVGRFRRRTVVHSSSLSSMAIDGLCGAACPRSAQPAPQPS
jgi:hypothetical protein